QPRNGREEPLTRYESARIVQDGPRRPSQPRRVPLQAVLEQELLMTSSNVTAVTKFLTVGEQRYSYRRFGSGSGCPLLLLQHFTGTLDNWDPAVTDPLASGREVILFENAGVGRSTGTVPRTIAGMARHALAFLDALGITRCDVLGFSLGGMIAQ